MVMMGNTPLMTFVILRASSRLKKSPDEELEDDGYLDQETVVTPHTSPYRPGL
jgi:hypothetical protein